jgi:formyltetrahydrofolate deformylase
LLNQHNCSIETSEHYTDRSSNNNNSDKSVFFQRIAFEDTFGTLNRELLQTQIQQVASERSLTASIDWIDERKQRMAIMVSKYDHCLWELLLRHQAQELPCDIPVILSNHPDLQHVADTFKIPFYIFPITPSNKLHQEQEQLKLLQEDYQIDLIVLARYMQVLSPYFLQHFPSTQVLNIHHSFLPAFSGGRPYHQAHARGVKLIGATAHYVTSDLDEGPILEQDVIRVSHRDSVRDYQRKGQWLERNVLVSAVQAHLQHRVIVYDHKCVVFSE